ncbi:hypothetical protein PPERSA_01452 [Pseudocohnilembus persalinus]|uniref:V-type proton ATPase subunit G n=1 Tax=Pseudocohnilembus persalinus TaxID=266149 RepID=A0A0V0QH37_PSEPJ|nr:hypothetical protein PPERSA_01452 [Pseudocohnilembus persalinus]|eukprot:KRX01549.1 hypothetical protein PPERSA_01452 [Pseudocohnilembus persalinus]
MSGQENWAVGKLLEAEKKANGLIQEAEQERQKYQALAQESASQTVQNFRQEQEAQFQAKVADLRKTDDYSELQKQTEKEVSEIRSQYEKNKKQVIGSLIDACLDVKVEIHPTVRDTIRSRFGLKKV